MLTFTVLSVQKTQLKCVFCMQVLQQPPFPLLKLHPFLVLRSLVRRRIPKPICGIPIFAVQKSKCHLKLSRKINQPILGAELFT